MYAWINFGGMITAGVLMTALYILSVRPAHLERRIGERAYRRCGVYRAISMAFMGVVMLTYILYRRYPLPIGLPETFGWPYWVSVVIALVIGIPALYLMIRGSVDAGTETAIPDKSHTLYGGIYRSIRHPQAAGEVWLWWVIAFLLNSPFLALFSLIWVPVWIGWCVAEEGDLVLRYGEAYETYREQTGMFFPRQGREG